MTVIKRHNFPSSAESPSNIVCRDEGIPSGSLLAQKSRVAGLSTTRKVLPRKHGNLKHAGNAALGHTRDHKPYQIFTSAEVLRDSSFLELVVDPSKSEGVGLLHWSNTKSAVAREHVINDCHYVPMASSDVIRHLPSQPVAYGSTSALFKEIADFIAKVSSLGETERNLLTFICFSAFFSECLNTSLCLLLHGSVVHAISMLRILSCICRHSVLLAGSSIRALPQGLRPTRLICQPDNGLDKLLAPMQFSGWSCGLRAAANKRCNRCLRRGCRTENAIRRVGDFVVHSPYDELVLATGRGART